MELSYPPEAETYRTQVRTFLSQHLPPGWRGIGALPRDEREPFVEKWVGTLRDNGLRAPTWPKEYGGAGLSPLEQVVLAEEFAKAGVPTGMMNDVFGVGMLGPTLMAFGSEEQKAHFLPRVLDGTDRWCQGYSEPGSGSDLASVQTRAVRDGDQWVVNGQKVWSSSAHTANWMFVLCRTDPDAPKHKGISFLLVPMNQPGIEVRPIRMITGESEFNEVFFADAVTDAANVVGGVNNGWAVAMYLLGHERGGAATTVALAFRQELDRLIEMARKRGATDDPLVRQRLAWSYSKVEIMRYLGMRTLTGFLRGQGPGPDAAIAKVYWSEYHRHATELAVDILGADALVPRGTPPASAFQADDPGSDNSTASWVGTFMNARAGTIYAGTSEVQRNIIGEMLLGLPKEPAAK